MRVILYDQQDMIEGGVRSVPIQREQEPFFSDDDTMM